MAIDSNIAGVVRVAYETDTGRFNAEVDQAARNYVEGNKEMSDSAVKLELAQDRLRRSIARGPAASREQQRALLGVRQAERELAAETARTTATMEAQQSRLGRLRGGLSGLAGPAGFGGLTTSIAGMAGGLLAGGGLLYALQRTVAAAKNSQVVLGQTSVAVDDAGISWAKYAGQVQAAAARISRASAFDDEAVLQSFQVFVRSQKNVQQSLNLAALAADVARGRYTDLETATQLVNKAALGQVGALRRVGIAIDKNATSTEALTALQRAYGGAATKYANSAAGSADRLNVSLENVAELTGGPLLNSISMLNNGLSISIDRMNRLGVSSDVAAAKLRNPAFDAGLARLGGPGVNLKALQQQFAAATLITAPGEGFVKTGLERAKPNAGKGGRGDGLSRFQRLTLTALRASATKDLRDDLAAARDLEGYYAGIAKNTKLKGDSLFKARQDLYVQQQRVQAIEDQIAADRQAAIETAAARREAAAARRKAARDRAAAKQKAEDAAERRAAQKAAKAATDALPGNTPYANTGAGFAKGGITPAEAARRTKAAKTAADKDTMTRDELGSILRDFLTGFGSMIDTYYGNVGGPGSHSTAVLESQGYRQISALEELARATRTPRVGFQRQLDEAAMLG